MSASEAEPGAGGPSDPARRPGAAKLASKTRTRGSTSLTNDRSRPTIGAMTATLTSSMPPSFQRARLAMAVKSRTVRYDGCVFRFSPQAAVRGDLALGVANRLARMPLVVLHDAGWQQIGAGEEGRDLRVGA